MQGFRHDCPFARLVAESAAGERLTLVDLGCQGGLDAGWRVFGQRLRALGVLDPGDAEPALADGDWGETRFIRHPLRLDDPRGRWRFDPLARLSAARTRQARIDREHGRTAQPLEAWVRASSASSSGRGGPLDLDYAGADGADPSVLAQALGSQGFAEPDFLRVDTSGDDLAVLRGLGGLLQRDRLLGVAVRVWMFGSHDARDDSFHNIDRLLRARGFELFGLIPVKYSLAALPSPYRAPHPDSTGSGRPVHAQAVYLRDLGQGENRALALGLPAGAIAKAAALFALFDLPDQAAELLLTHDERLSAAGLDVERGLDLLAAQAQEDSGGALGYRDYVAAFDADHPSFFDLDARVERWMAGLRQTAREAPARIGHLESLLRASLTEQYLAAKPARDATPEQAVAAARRDVDRRSLLYPPHHWVFDHFGRYIGPATPAFYIDAIGARTDPDFVSWGPLFAQETYDPGLPGFDEEYFEWADILQAVLDAGPCFTMLELGAGYGRWSARAALAARQLGKSVRLGLAEAEPRHQGFLRRHMADNGVDPSHYRVFDTCVAGSGGEVVFAVRPPPEEAVDNWFGQSAMPQELKGSVPIGDYFGLPLHQGAGGWGCVIVPRSPLSAILEPYDAIDIVDFDLQGAEAEAIAEGVQALTRKVRRLHIGTHGHDIEADLRRILSAAGWVCLRDHPCHQQNDTPFGRFAFVDGVQTWINPARDVVRRPSLSGLLKRLSR